MKNPEAFETEHSPEEIAEIKRERSFSDAQLVGDGAKYKIDEHGDKENLIVTKKQIKEILKEKESGEQEYDYYFFPALQSPSQEALALMGDESKAAENRTFLQVGGKKVEFNVVVKKGKNPNPKKYGISADAEGTLVATGKEKDEEIIRKPLFEGEYFDHIRGKVKESSKHDRAY
jgi:hypothetical protein